MPFYFRKSVSAGPFRFNFSKGGVGMSVGVRGLRIGTGPRGHYVHAGRGGLYYKASLGRAGERRAARPSPNSPLNDTKLESGVVMVEVESGDILQMRPESHSQLIEELNAKQRQMKLSAILLWTFIGSGVLALPAGPGVSFTLWGLSIAGLFFGRWVDGYRRSSVLFYDLEPDAEQAYTAVTNAFDGLSGCLGKWHVEAGGAVTDLTTWKRNAGASHIVRKKPTTLHYALPQVIKSNITPPSMAVGRQTLFFLPDVLLVVDGKQIGAVAYSELDVRYQDSRFIEEASVPGDALVVGHTWQHPNKNGGPDRRFASNRQIPICLYEVMHLRSPSGLNELVEFSRHGVAPDFLNALRSLTGTLGANASTSSRAMLAAR